VSNDLIARIWALGTPAVADAMDSLGLDPSPEPLSPAVPGSRIAGAAFTVLFAGLEPGRRPEPLGDYLQDVSAGEIVLLANGGRMDCSVWGDVLAEAARARGAGGTVIDGACRDRPELAVLGYPVFSRGACARSGKGRVWPASRQVPVRIGRLSVEPGDVLCADDSGVLAVPRARLAEVVAAGEDLARGDARMRAALRAGVPLPEARALRAAPPGAERKSR
jgi:regulator of RNase E activity RraA